MPRVSLQSGPMDSQHDKNDARTDDSLEWTKEEEEQVVRKIDTRLLPLLAICYMFRLLVTNSLSSASILGIIEDLRLEDSQFSWTISIFYFGYCFFTYPTSIIMVKFPLGKYVSSTVVIWAAIAILHAACYNFGGLMAVRAFLGVAEATCTPAFAILVGRFYKRSEHPSRQNIWFLGQVIGIVADAFITWGLTHLSGSLPTWQYTFLIFGSSTLIWGVVMLIFLPDHPSTSNFLSVRERQIAAARVATNNDKDSSIYKKEEAIEALKDPQIWLLTLYTFAVHMANGGFGAFGLLILTGLGFEPRTTLLLQAPFAGFQLIYVTIGIMGTSIKNCRLFTMMFLMTLSVVGVTMTFAIQENHPWARYGGFCLATAFVANLPISLSLVTSNVGGQTKRSTALSMIFIGTCLGNIVGPHFFLQSESPSYPTGLVACIVGLAAAMAFLVALRAYYMWQNRKRSVEGLIDLSDSDAGTATTQQSSMSKDNQTDISNKNFVYVL